MNNQETSHTNKNHEACEPEKISRGEKIFALAVAWLMLTFVLYWKFSDIAPEQSYLYYLYPFFSAYVIIGAWYQSWYLVTFKNTVGRPKFFFTVFVEIVLLIVTIMVAEKGYGGIRLFLLFFTFSIVHAGLVVALYRDAKKKMN